MVAYNIRTGVKKIKTKTSLALTAAGLGLAGLAMAIAIPLGASAAGGFNANGYNYGARIFSGAADGVDKTLDGTVYGDPTYANDHLVMKWNAQWDNCNAAGNDTASACAGAMLTNEWNGMVPGGSGETEHFKAIWVGSAGEASPYWQPGGYLIWNNYEAIMDQGMSGGAHWVLAHATPNGFGVSK